MALFSLLIKTVAEVEELMLFGILLPVVVMAVVVDAPFPLVEAIAAASAARAAASAALAASAAFCKSLFFGPTSA